MRLRRGQRARVTRRKRGSHLSRGYGWILGDAAGSLGLKASLVQAAGRMWGVPRYEDEGLVLATQQRLVEDHAQRAFMVIRNGGLALVKADIGYGFLGNSANSIERMYDLKGRAPTNPAIVAGNVTTLRSIGRLPDPSLLDWIAELLSFTTLAVVTVMREESPLIRGLEPWVLGHASENGTIATFLNTGEYVERMVDLANDRGILLVGSSANLSGTGNNFAFEEVPESIRAGVDYRFDGGVSRYQNSAKLATTIVNLTDFSVRRCGVNYNRIISSYQEFAAERGQLPPNLLPPTPKEPVGDFRKEPDAPTR